MKRRRARSLVLLLTTLAVAAGSFAVLTGPVTAPAQAAVYDQCPNGENEVCANQYVCCAMRCMHICWARVCCCGGGDCRVTTAQ